MPTVSDLIHSSFRLIGAIAAGEILETNELNDAFISLNQMIQSWNTEGLSLVGRQFLYVQVGPASNGYALPATERPVQIESASLAISGINVPLEIVDSVGWNSVPEQQQLSIYVQKLYCDYGYPIARISLWPTPRMAGQLAIVMYTPLGAFSALTDVIDFAPGYEIALRTNFAVLIEPEYPRSQMDPLLPAQAQNYKASLVQLNRLNHMRSQTSSPMQTAIADIANTAAR